MWHLASLRGKTSLFLFSTVWESLTQITTGDVCRGVGITVEKVLLYKEKSLLPCSASVTRILEKSSACELFTFKSICIFLPWLLELLFTV